jgi:hypothetical protein
MTDRWALLAYRLPREPSSPRIALWRRLRRLGVALLQDGLVGLPLDSRNREQLEWIAEEVAEAGGDAHLWIAEPASARQGRDLARQLAEAIADEYRVVATEADATRDADAATRRRTVRRLRRELRRIRTRDYFPPPERETATRAVDRLAALDTPTVHAPRVQSGSAS